MFLHADKLLSVKLLLWRNIFSLFPLLFLLGNFLRHLCSKLTIKQLFSVGVIQLMDMYIKGIHVKLMKAFSNRKLIPLEYNASA